jgi:CSLREA domain-containing protein
MNQSQLISKHAPERRLLSLAMLIVGLALMLLPAMAAYAASFAVNTTADTADVKPGDGKCADSKGKCSLRAAIQESNAFAGDDVIVLGAATYTLTTTLPSISSSLTIQGVSAGATIIQRPCVESTRNEVGECGSPDFRIIDVAEQGVLQLTGLTVRNGQEASGGGISNKGSLTLIESTVMGNHGHVGGGGILNYGKLWLVDSTVRENFGHNGSGGGIANLGDVQIWGSTISGNKSTYAGGIYNGAGGKQGGSLTITNSTISGNQAFYPDAPITSGYAGGILNDGIGDAWLWSVTITANTAPSAGGVWGHIQGSGNFYFANTIIAGNTVTGSGKVAPDCYGSVITLGWNLVGNTSGCGVTPQPGDVIGKDPKLGPLADNGGPSCTHQLLDGGPDGNPAIDAASPDQPGSGGFSCETFDQRGATRVNRCDIGAYEAYATAEPHQLGCSGL